MPQKPKFTNQSEKKISPLTGVFPVKYHFLKNLPFNCTHVNQVHAVMHSPRLLLTRPGALVLLRAVLLSFSLAKGLLI